MQKNLGTGISNFFLFYKDEEAELQDAKLI